MAISIAVVQEQGSTSIAASTTLSCSWPAATGAGNLLILGVACGDNSLNVTLTPPAGWTLIDTPVTALNGSNPITTTALYYKKNAASESGSKKVTFSQSVWASMFLMEVSGCDTASPLDQTASNTQTATTTLTSGTTTTASGGSSAAFVRVVDSQGITGTGTTMTLTVPASGCAVGNTLILASTKQVSTVTDAKGNTWTLDKTQAGTGLNASLASSRISTALVSGDLITVTFTGSVNARAAVCCEYSGVSAGSYVDAAAFGTDITSTGTSSSVTGAAATGQSYELVVATSALDFNASSPVAGTGYTLRTSAASLGTVRTVTLEDKFTSTTATQTATLSWTGSAAATASIVGGYKATSTGGVANEIVVAVISENSNFTLSTPTNGFTLQDTQKSASSGTARISSALLYKIVSATGSQTAGVTASGTNPAASKIATFKISTGGGGGILAQLTSMGSGAGPLQFPLGPPDMTGATTLTDPGVSAVWAPSLTDGVDYILSAPNQRSRMLKIVGGRNVYVPKLFITFTTIADSEMVYLGGGNTGRIVHIDTCHLDPNGLQCDAIKTHTSFSGRHLQLRLCRIEKMIGQTSQVHADLLQASGGLGDLWVEDFTGYSTYDGFMLQREANLEQQTTSFTVSAASVSGANYVFTATGHTFAIDDPVAVWNCTSTQYNGGFTVLSVSGNTFTVKKGDNSPGALTGNGKAALMSFAYDVGSINFNRVNVKGFHNDLQNTASLQSIRFGARTAPVPNAGNPGTVLNYQKQNEDQTPLNIDQWNGALTATSWYGNPDFGDVGQYVEPDSGASNYSGARPVYHGGGVLTTRAGGDHGGGFVQASAVDTLNAGRYAAGGDTFGVHVTNDYGANWQKRMRGFNVTAGGAVGPDLPIRALAFSKRPANSGRLYVGQGQIHSTTTGNGFFGYLDLSTATSVHKGSTVDGFGTAMTGAAGQPRPAGQLIVSEYVGGGTDTEYVYALTPLGLQRTLNSASQTPGDNRTVLALSSATMWRWMLQLDANTMMCVTWCQDFSGNAVNSSVYIVSGSVALATATSGQITTTLVTGTPTRVNAVKIIGGNVYAACIDGVYLVTNLGTTWTKISGTFFSNEILAIGGLSNTIVAIQRNSSASKTQTIARSTAGSGSTGASWSWLVTTTNVINQLWGDGNPWWLYLLASTPNQMNRNPAAGQGTAYIASNIEIDPNTSSIITSFGPPGCWQSRDSGATWRPSMNGLNGAEKNLIRLDGSVGAVTVQDVDYVASKSTDRLVTATNNPSPGTFTGSAALTRTYGSSTYIVTTGTPSGLTKDGTNVEDEYFRNACINPYDMRIDQDGTIYIAQSGGGTLVIDATAYADWPLHPNVLGASRIQQGDPPAGDFVVYQSGTVVATAAPTVVPSGAGAAVKTATSAAALSAVTATAYPNAYDLFERIVTAGGLDVADLGGSYTLSGTAADFSVNGTQAVIAVTAAAQNKRATLSSVSMVNQYATGTFQTDTQPAGSYTAFDVFLRFVDASNYYRCRAILLTSGGIQLRWDMSLAGTITTLKAAVTSPLTLILNNDYGIYASAVGTSPTSLSAYVWDATAAPPPLPVPVLTSVADSSSALQVASAAGFGAGLNTGSTATGTKVSVAGWDVWSTRWQSADTVVMVQASLAALGLPASRPVTGRVWTPRS